jgi:cysteinyl-tRNA synthetase
MHGNMLTVEGRKMAKSEGNGFTPEELVTGNHKLLERGYSPMTVRFFMLQCHYASTLDFSNAALQAAEKGLQRLMAANDILARLKPTTIGTAFDVDALVRACIAAMNDDLNTPVMIAHLFDGVRAINGANDGNVALSEADIDQLRILFDDMLFTVMGLMSEAEAKSGDELSSGLMNVLLTLRADAKNRKDFAASDLIRDKLAELGVTVKDTKDGPVWERA